MAAGSGLLEYDLVYNCIAFSRCVRRRLRDAPLLTVMEEMKNVAGDSSKAPGEPAPSAGSSVPHPAGAPVQPLKAVPPPLTPIAVQKPTSDGVRAEGRWWMRGEIAALLVVVTLTIGISWVIGTTYEMPAAIRTFAMLSVAAGGLVVAGLVILIVVIPAVRFESDVKTEFYSARAAYLCVIAGLILFAIITIGAVVARVSLTLGSPR